MRVLLIAFSFLGMIAVGPVHAQNGPVVIELYTSQGCSACPPADAMLAELAKRDDVIALALHVDYWDYIGWEDVFADPAYSARQHAYANAARVAAVYTPQMIINGQDHVVGSRTMQVMDRLQAQQAKGLPLRVTMTRQANRVLIAAPPTESGDYVVQLVRYTPEQTMVIARGENAGHEYTYTNTVTSLNVIHRWDGASALGIDAPAEGTDPVVVIIQKAGHGAIVAAAELR
ncbi:thioredoxin family protein [Yoonia sp.]|uniref:DUF1223 domain-containing protein n=1 Tax=Yoonia sp. TaxID=2212373 RepID=UPI0019E9DC9A|nr:DUF1223 domain-containing protein [Yoonia sp.]MBE0414148.1 DUF1223 domain-containing protein [Yoonia sp.]